MSSDWTALSAAYLLRTTTCPRCNAELAGAPICPVCRADLRGEAGELVFAASEAAAEALRDRQTLIDALPLASAAASAAVLAGPVRASDASRGAGPSGATPVAATTQWAAPDAVPGEASGPAVQSAPPGVAATVAPPAAPAAAPESPISVQSVLAVAGAGLLAVAAIVFTYLNPDVGLEVRTTVIGVLTALFGAGAWLLQRRGVTFSAEAIGALAMVFLAFDVQALVELAPPGTSGWWFAAAGALLASAAMFVVARLVRIRTWLWASLVGLVLVPAFIGYAVGGEWGPLWGHVFAAGAALGGRQLARTAERRFASRLRTEHVTLVVLQISATGIALLQLPWPSAASTLAGVFGRVAVLLVLAGLAVFATRFGQRWFWSFLGGVLAVVAAALVPLAFAPPLDDVWLIGLLPAATAVPLVLSGLLREPTTSAPDHGAADAEGVAQTGDGDAPVRGIPIHAAAMRLGALLVALAVGLPAFFAVGQAVLRVVVDFAATMVGARLGLAPRLSAGGAQDADLQLAAVLGVAAIAIATGGLALLSRGRSRSFARGLAVLSLWTGAWAGWGFIGWTSLTPLAAALIGIGAAACAAALVIMPVSRLSRAGVALRAPIVVFGHVALVGATMLTWIDPAITVAVGALAVLCVAPLARALPPAARPFSLGVAYAYTLVLFATALDRLDIEPIAILCLTTTLGGVVALGATVARRLPGRYWYAVLAVTAVPFLIGVAGVLVERSGWTALSTGVIFVLAAALVLTRRPGLTLAVRAGAGALLLPALAVVVVCLAAQFLDASGSPVALPVIAGLTAATFALVGPARPWLRRRGLSAAEADAVSLWVELSAYPTAAITVLLALAREAAGLDTAAIVLIVLGLGAVALRVLGGRRHGWWIAAGCWTGALWCLLASFGVDVLEPYTLPPALGAVAVGAIALVRRGRGVALFASGIACAVLPTLVVLAVAGAAGGSALATSAGWTGWRVWALLAASAVLALIGALVARGPESAASVRRLRAILLIGAVVAAAGGPVQAVRWGLGADVPPLDSRVVLPALGLSLAGAALAAIAGGLLLRGGVGSRWLFAPAVAYLALGPVAAVRHDWLAIWIMWSLMLLLLAFAIGTVVAARDGRTVLPPFWYSYALAWLVGVTGWSQRELRVEAFSLPLGLSVLAAGIVAMFGASWWRSGASKPAEGGAAPEQAVLQPRVNDWPLGFTGSWPVLAPGIVLTLLPSVLATGTDPQLYRPIMVIAVALAAILVGSALKLAAPFLLGLAVLPVENVVVFAAQLDRAVGAMPWWITLATAGTVLLAISVSAERRTSQGRGVAARLRELR